MDELEYITKDALMMCDQGGAPDFFTPTFNTHIKIHGCVAATNMDGAPLTNIPSFKVCKVTQKSCTPATAPMIWKDTWPVKVKGIETLIGRSTCPCSVGGKIEFMTSGQIPLPPEAQEEVDALQKQADRELNDAGHGDSVGETGFVEGMVPVWGSGKDLINDIQTGDGWGAVVNTGFLVWDVGSIVVGVFTAGGGTAAMQAVKAGVKGTTKAVAKKLSKKALQKLGKSAFNKLKKEALQSTTKQNMIKLGLKAATACFSGDTLVHTKDGLKEIRHIKTDDLVWSFNEKTKEIGLKRVTSLSIAEVNNILEITTITDTIKTTPNHPFYVNGAYKDAEQIKIDDVLFSKNGKTIKVIGLNYLDETVKVYNFEVKDNHCYFVGIEGVLVHNICKELIEKAIKKISSDPNKIHHILKNRPLVDNHNWSRLVPDKNWDDVSKIISRVLEDGVEGTYKGVTNRILQIGDDTVEVVYKEIDGEIFISDAWVK